MALAAPFASLVAVLAGLPSPLEGTAETLMEWTPVPIASFLLIHVGSIARPAALLGAFAVALLIGGIAGAIGGLAAVLFQASGLLLVGGGSRRARRPTTMPPSRTISVGAYCIRPRLPAGRLGPQETPCGADRDGATVPTEVSRSERALIPSIPPRPRAGEGVGGEGLRRARQEPVPAAAWIFAITVATALLDIVFLAVLTPAAIGPVVLMVVTFAAMMLGLEFRPVRRAGRREFLTRTGAIVGGAGALVVLYYLRPLVWAAGGRQLAAYRPPRGLGATGVTHLVTPQDRFYVNDKVVQAPDLAVSGWQFAVTGAVRREVRLDYAALLAWPAVRRYVTMECVDNPVGGPLIGNALWTGVRLADLLNEAGARGEMVICTAADNYAEGLPRKLLEQHDALIVYAMNGETLSRDHGYPARLLVPGLYGFKSVKWLTGMEVVTGTYDDIWRQRGWSEAPVVHTMTRIDSTRRDGDRVIVTGIAFAGDRGIRAVEVRVDGGVWSRARLGPVLSHATWVQWVVTIRGGRHARIEARAIDGLGNVQPGREHGAYPDGASGWATVTA